MARSGKLIHYRVNPPRKKATCPVCLKTFTFQAHDRSKRINLCSKTCHRPQVESAVAV